MNKITRFTKILAILSLAVGVSFGQGTALTATTTSAAITSTSANTITLTSSTGILAQGTQGQFNTMLYIGKELIGVRSLVSGTTWSVARGQQSTRPLTYPSGIAVLLGSPTGNFNSADYTAEVVPGTTCVAANVVTLPHIYLKSGNTYDCLGVAGAQQWVLTNSDYRPVVGSTVASTAGVIAATGNIFTISGTAAITGITVPQGWASGMCLRIIPSGAFTTTTATNVGLASTGVVGKTLFECWNAATSKWYPSY